MNLIITAIVTLILSHYLPGIVVSGFFSALFFALVLGIFNFFLGNILKLVGCLVNLITLGLFNAVINVFMVLLAAKMINGVYIDGFFSAAILAIAISFFTTAYENKTDMVRR